jgi:uncharacterized membrane protein YhhN
VTVLFTVACAVAVAALLEAEWRRPTQRRLPKMVASSAFLVVAVAAGATGSRFGWLILVGLALSWLGDLLLTFAGRTAFTGGLAAFLLAHVAYVAAFVDRGLDGAFVPLLGMMALVGAGVARWLLPTVPRELKLPVIAYLVAISTMVAAAASTNGAAADIRIPLGAVAFYLSDLGVARDRFAAPGVANRLIGLPLYFGGQLLLAWAAGG